jgi:phospholipid N-methyltransferase
MPPPRFLRDHFAFFRQFRETFESTGAIAPSSRFLARAMTGPLSKRDRPVRVLEVGPGTGAVTQRIVRLLQPGDRFDLVELNPVFANILRGKFDSDPAYHRVADQSAVHQVPVQEFTADQPYDFIISGLPLNNFPTGLVREIFETFFRLLAPGGTLSYFEYMYVRPIRKVIGSRPDRMRLRELEAVIQPYLRQHRIHRSWVFANLPPAWVQHLRPRLHGPA